MMNSICLMFIINFVNYFWSFAVDLPTSKIMLKGCIIMQQTHDNRCQLIIWKLLQFKVCSICNLMCNKIKYQHEIYFFCRSFHKILNFIGLVIVLHWNLPAHPNCKLKLEGSWKFQICTDF